MFGFDINIYICFLTLGLVPVIVFRLWYWRPKGKSCKITKCIAVMSRYPIIGKTKTRLIPKLGISGAAVCQLYMTEHLLNTVSDFYKESQDFRVTVHYHGGTEKQVAHWLKQRQINDGLLLSWQQQYGKSLGDRLVNVAKSCFDNGDEHVIITGSDIPSINKDVLSEVFHKLKCKESNIILGQAKDGGYYLIALSRDCREFLDDIFDEIDWGTDKVFQQQVTRIKKVDLSLYIIEQVLSDVDLAEDFPVFEREIGINLIQIKHPTWSIIIPTLNEEKTIVKSISSILKNCSDVRKLEEIIVSDGGSNDNTIQCVQDFSKTTSVPITIVHSLPGRGIQLYHGADKARGSLLCFLHADAVVPVNFDELAEESLMIPGNSAVVFSFQLDVLEAHYYREQPIRESWWFIFQLHVIAKSVNARSSKFELPYGDQGFCLKKTTYTRVGGFDKVYLMEDVMMVDKCKKLGHIVTVPQAVVINSRRWKRKGVIRVTLWNQFILMAYRLGVNQQTLAIWYYGEQIKSIIQNSKEH